MDTPISQRTAKPSGKPMVVLDHLSGFHRGTRQILTDDDLEIGTAPEASIHFPADHEPSVSRHHARITRRDGLYELSATGGARIRVNGNVVVSHILSPGDLILVGERGPVIRFRTYGQSDRRFKSITEALADCRDYAVSERASAVGRVWEFLRQAPHEILQQTAPWTRTLTFALVTILFLATAYLAFVSYRLQRSFDTQSAMLSIVQEDRGTITSQELRDLRTALESQLSETIERVEALEEMSEAAQRIVASSAQSIAFLLGDYSFFNAEGRPLRTVVGPDGQQVFHRNGRAAVSPDGTGPPFRAEFAGTGFVATDDGLLLTNRHIAAPWEFDANAQALISAGYRPVMNRFAGYLPGDSVSFDVKPLVVSDSVDLAILECDSVHIHAPPIPLGEAVPEAGDEVYVLGYPTGIRALLARTNVRFVNRLLQETDRDFWTIAQRLAASGHIAPLATSGIVGQVTPTYVVYDAETTHGGSGGPVIGRNGRVVAVNAAILNDFGGSNLGIPVSWATSLFELARNKRYGPAAH